MNATTWKAALAGAYVLIAGAAAWSVAGFERTLAAGQVVLVELAPVDPRSLMQGDYMALRFEVDRHLREKIGGSMRQWRDPAPPPAYAYLALDAQRRATLAGVGDRLPAPAGQVAMRIRVRHNSPSVGPNAFFFQEGTASAYEGAKWGEFRVAPNGKALLTHLRDGALAQIKPP
ncbi:MAG: GDYXXLXY domain-containing protein, partial [Burkholderiaceae bacterium]|nr:GDYXXLXY domain-containing protein [Burkholderiaceae bacterium]